MASVLDQLIQSTLSLNGNGFNPQPFESNWGYVDLTKDLNPALSKLHYEYSVNSNPKVRLVDFNKFNGTSVKKESNLDELDPAAPNNYQAGLPGSVVSTIYKSALGRKYPDLGPQPGRY